MIKNKSRHILHKLSLGKLSKQGFAVCFTVFLFLSCFISTSFAAENPIVDNHLKLKDLKVGDIKENGVVTAIDENGYFFKIDESETMAAPMSVFSGSLRGIFDFETTLNNSAFYFGGQAVCKNLAGGAGAVQFKLGDTAVGVPPGSGYSFAYVWGNKDLTVQSIEVWGTRTVTWEIIE